MKKIIILAIALLSTGIVLAAITHKSQSTLKPVVKTENTTAVTDKNVPAEAIASAD